MLKPNLLFVFCLMVSSAMFSQAPSYVDFEWEILSLGFAAPIGSDAASSGIAIGGELRYNLKDNFSIGLGSEGALFGSNFSDGSDLGASSNINLNGDYYLSSTSGSRGFFGGSLGYYRSGDVTIGGATSLDGGSTVGMAARVGYELGHVRFTGKFHVPFKSEVSKYFSLNVGLVLWGGYKGS